MDNYELIDNIEEKQYEFHVEQHVVRVEYIKTNNGEIFLTHTEVPIALEGQGIGSRLIAGVLADVERQGFQLMPLCPFVAGYIRKHPEWKRILKKGVNV